MYKKSGYRLLLLLSSLYQSRSVKVLDALNTPFILVLFRSVLFQSIVQIVETTIPNAAETLYTSTTSIIENFPQIFKDPKTAVAKIGKAVTR